MAITSEVLDPSLLLFFADKDVEIGWLEYILSIDIGILFPACP
jgi:hypothetical protein